MKSLTFSFSEKVYHVSWPQISIKCLHYPLVGVLRLGTSLVSDTVGINLPTGADPNLPVYIHWAGEAWASVLPAKWPWPVWWRDRFIYPVSSSQHHWGLGPDPVCLLWQDGDTDWEQDGVPALHYHGQWIFSPRKWYKVSQGLSPLFLNESLCSPKGMVMKYISLAPHSFSWLCGSCFLYPCGLPCPRSVLFLSPVNFPLCRGHQWSPVW